MSTCSVNYDAFGAAAFFLSVALVLCVLKICNHRFDMARLKAKKD